MARKGDESTVDLFLELADNQSSQEAELAPSPRTRRLASRLSNADKRRSLPVEAFAAFNERRPSTSGQIFGGRPSSRLNTSNIHSELQRQAADFASSPIYGSNRFNDSVPASDRTFSGGRPRRYSVLPSRSPMSPSRVADRMRFPESQDISRRRTSFGAASLNFRQNSMDKTHEDHDESPLENSEPRRAESTSADSQTADTVWDELDDLKSRIKKLELSGPQRATSRPPVSGDSSERPRTATTAPTTIDSSPKHDRTAHEVIKKVDSTADVVLSGPSTADVHPLLHSALAKAKPLLNPSLYRTLEMTASDALQLAAMAGSSGPQGTAFSAASIINGVAASERQIRRRADTMCRNLTELCLALCDGKHETSSGFDSPMLLADAAHPLPASRFSHHSLGPASAQPSRPVSRLEARRTSILGIPSAGSIGRSPSSAGDISASEQGSTPTLPLSQRQRRSSQVSSSLPRPQLRRRHDMSGDDDLTIRPPSRAMTDVGNIRAQPGSGVPKRTPSLRQTLESRRVHESSHRSNRETSYTTPSNSELRTRRYYDHATPPVLEEDGGDYHSAGYTRRPGSSMGRQYSSRRSINETPLRAPSLSQRRHVAVE